MTMEGIDYDPGDYLLINKHGQIVAVSGNSDFWDMPEALPPVNPNGSYMVGKVLVVQKRTASAIDRRAWVQD